MFEDEDEDRRDDYPTLKDCLLLSDEQLAAEAARLRREAAAKSKHADALAAWCETHPAPADEPTGQ
jgi:hypothetical protein